MNKKTLLISIMTMALTTATNMLAHEGNKNKANEEPQLVEER